MAKSRQFTFRLEGAELEDQSVSFRMLANVLNGIQHTFYCIGLEVAGREAKSRGRMPEEIRQACELRRMAERPGSYEVVAQLTASNQDDLFNYLGKDTLIKYMTLIDYLDNPSGNIRDIFPDGVHRRRILRSVEAYCPREGDEWILVFEDSSRQSRGTLNGDTRKKIRNLLKPPDEEMLTVTGELMRLHLDEHKISILYPPTQRILDCFYDVEIEDFIIGNLKGLIQVTGRVQLDAAGHPDKIVDVISIDELDLRTVRLSKLSAGNTVLKLAQPLIIEPQYEEQEVILEYPAFHIIASGASREEAIAVLEKDFIWLWKEYAMDDDSELSLDAQQLKQELLSLVKE